MRMPMTIVFAALAPCVVFGGLGETLDQSIQHYGAVITKSQSEQLPVSEASMLYEFSKDGFRVQERFVNGKAAWVLYLKEDRPIYDTEIRTLLDNNAEGSTWSVGKEEQDKILKKKITYNRADSLADAEYNEIGNYHGLIIITKAWRHATSPASRL